MLLLPPDTHTVHASYTFNVYMAIRHNRSGERILDVGCGDGVLTSEIKARGCQVVGIDFAPEMLAAATEKVRHGRPCMPMFV